MNTRISWMMAATLAFSLAARGAEITGTSGGRLWDGAVAVTTDASDPANGGQFQMLHSGDYTISNPSSVISLTSLGGGNQNLAMDAGTSLAVQANTNKALSVNEFIMRGGELDVRGPTASGFGAMDVQGEFIQSGGSVATVGGASLESHGITAAKYTQAAGAIEATGGSGFRSVGLEVYGHFEQTSGALIAQAGTGSWAHGFSAQTATFNDQVIIRRGGGGRAMDVGGNDTHLLTFGSTSSLVVDLGGAGDLPFIRATTMQIDPGATVTFLNTTSIPSGTTQYDFIETTNTIHGEFAFQDSATLNMIIAKTGYWDQFYTASFNRTGTAGSLAGSTPGVGANASKFLSSLDAVYGTSALDNNPHLAADLSIMDGLTDPREIADFANHLAAKYTPVDAVSAVSSMATSVNTMAQKSMVRNVFAPASGGGMAAVSASSTDAVASFAATSGTIRSVWLTPMAQWSRTRALTNGFSKAQENIFGAGVGFGVRQENNFAAGISFHYLRSNLNSRTTDVDSNIYGLNLFGRKYLADCPPYAPFIEGGVGYSYVDSKQVRKILDNRSKPESHILNANMAFGVDLLLGNTTLTPKIGFDYNHVNSRSYRESGPSGLSVSPDNFNSFRGIIGIGMKNQINDCFYVTASAAYKHEFADRNAVTSNRLSTVPDILFVTEGERRSRSSGDFGVGLGWQARSNVLVGVNYDLSVGEKTQSHSLAARLALDF